MGYGNGFMDYMGYRNMVAEDKIEECLDLAESGAERITVDRGDLTDDEAAYVEKEVRRRLGLD